jgi:hypothetical protein
MIYPFFGHMVFVAVFVVIAQYYSKWKEAIPLLVPINYQRLSFLRIHIIFDE